MNKENGALLNYIALILKELNESEPNLFALRQLLTNFYPLLNINELTRQGIKPLGERVKNLVPQDVASEPFRQELRQFLTEVEFFLNGTPQAQITTNTITPETLEALVKAQEEQATRIKTAENNWKTKWEQLIREYNGRLDRLFVEKLPDIPADRRAEIVYRVSETVRKHQRETMIKEEPVKSGVVVEMLTQSIMRDVGFPANASPQLAEIILQGYIQAQVLSFIPLENEITEASQLAALLQVRSQSFGITGDVLIGSLAVALTDIRRNQGEQSFLPNSPKAAETLAQLKNVALLTAGVELPPLALAGVLDWAYRVMPDRKFFHLPAPSEVTEKGSTQPSILKQGVTQLPVGPFSFLGRFVSELVNRSGLLGIWNFLFSSGQAVFQRINLGPVLNTGLNSLFSGAGKLFSNSIAVNRQRALLGAVISPATRSTVLITIVIITVVFFVFNPLESVHLVDSAAILPANAGPFPEGVPPPAPPGGYAFIDPQGCEQPQGGEVCCVPKAGYCSPQNPTTHLGTLFGDQARNAAQICARESIMGRAYIVNDSCLPCDQRQWVKRCDINTLDYSVGLFQINMLAHPNRTSDFVASDPRGAGIKKILDTYHANSCADAFSAIGVPCAVTNPNLLAECVAWFQDPVNNENYADALSQGGKNWNPWSTARSCRIVQ